MYLIKNFLFLVETDFNNKKFTFPINYVTKMTYKLLK